MKIIVMVVFILHFFVQSIDTDALMRTILDVLRGSAAIHCKAWDHKKCKAVDYVHSFLNKSSTFWLTVFSKPMGQYSIMEWNEGALTIPSCIQYLG